MHLKFLFYRFKHYVLTHFFSGMKNYLKYFNIILGLALACIGAIITIFSNVWVENFIDAQLQLKPGSAIFKLWSKPDINLTINFYFFNWTNPNDFLNLTVKPKFQQVGPYSFDEVPYKKVVRWHPKYYTVEYEKLHTYYFNKARTKGSLTDKITSINALLVGAAAKSRSWSFAKFLVDGSLKFYNENTVWQKTVEELLFKGFQSPIVTILNGLPRYAKGFMDIHIPFNRMGYMYDRNGTSKLIGTQTISTGVAGMTDYGELKFWQGKNKTRKLPSECAAVRGSPGELQKTKLQKFLPIEYFSVDICRNVFLDYHDEIKIHNTWGYQYKVGARVLDNGTTYAENKCYCNGECLPSGAVNITSCLYGLPIFVSAPHFLDADKRYLDDVEGLQPNREFHETSMVLDPRTGFLLEFKGRMQLNLYLEPSKHLSAYRNERRILFPLMWVDAYVQVTPEISQFLYILNNLKTYCQLFGITLFLGSMIAILWKPVKKCQFHQYPLHLENNRRSAEEDENKEMLENYAHKKGLDKNQALLNNPNNITDIHDSLRYPLKYYNI